MGRQRGAKTLVLGRVSTLEQKPSTRVAGGVYFRVCALGRLGLLYGGVRVSGATIRYRVFVAQVAHVSKRERREPREKRDSKA